jgi:hypothetical protein
LAKEEQGRKQAADAAEAKASPQQLGQRVEKAANKEKELERQVEIAAKRLQEHQERLARLNEDLKVARAETTVARSKMLNSQVPDLGSVPVSLDGAFRILRAKAQASGATELVEKLEALHAEACPAPQAEATAEAGVGGCAGGGAGGASATAAPGAQQECQGASAAHADGGFLDNIDEMELDDETLARLDATEGASVDAAASIPSDATERDAWRIAQRKKARQIASSASVLAKRCKRVQDG